MQTNQAVCKLSHSKPPTHETEQGRTKKKLRWRLNISIVFLHILILLKKFSHSSTTQSNTKQKHTAGFLDLCLGTDGWKKCTYQHTNTHQNQTRLTWPHPERAGCSQRQTIASNNHSNQNGKEQLSLHKYLSSSKRELSSRVLHSQKPEKERSCMFLPPYIKCTEHKRSCVSDYFPLKFEAHFMALLWSHIKMLVNWCGKMLSLCGKQAQNWLNLQPSFTFKDKKNLLWFGLQNPP